jgi:hypothetical protein
MHELGYRVQQATCEACKDGQEVGHNAWFISEACALSGGANSSSESGGGSALDICGQNRLIKGGSGADGTNGV